MRAANNNAGEWCTDVGTTTLIVELVNADFRNIGVADSEISVGLRLLDIEYRNEIRSTQFSLTTWLAIELTYTDLSAPPLCFLFRTPSAPMGQT